MTETELRRIIVDALAEASVFRFRQLGIAEAFIEGTADAAFEDLEADSLARMELCIAIEANTGVEVLPAQLDELRTLGNVVALVRQRQRLVETYERMISGAKSVNELNGVNILLERTMTPAEVIHLWSTITLNPGYFEPAGRLNKIVHPEVVQKAILKWLGKLKTFHDQIGKAVTEPYGRVEISKELTFYTAGGATEGKTLLLSVTGSGLFMMMPTATYLQLFDATQVDVALVRDIPFRGYRAGLEGISPTVEEIGPELAARLSFDKYQRIAVVGISGGCIAALLASIMVEADAAVVVGMGHPEDERWIRSDGVSAGELIRQASENRRLPKMTFVYGAQSPTDEAAALAFAKYVPSANLARIAVEGVEVAHNAIYPLLPIGRLMSQMHEWLGM